jgi:IstB-like ATP binding protein
MLVQTTLDTLNRLKLFGMAAALAEQLNNSAAASLSFEERFGLLVDREVLHRDNRRLTRLLQLAQPQAPQCLHRGRRLPCQPSSRSRPDRQPRHL